jgi:hypothetical protein
MPTWLWLYAPVALPGIVARICFAREIASALQWDDPSSTHKNLCINGTLNYFWKFMANKNIKQYEEKKIIFATWNGIKGNFRKNERACIIRQWRNGSSDEQIN